jgi:YegS/Rv2252/BmrU family lipid kinase
VKSKDKIAFIINPKSGTTQKCDIPQIIHQTIDKNRFDVTIQFTKCAGHATELASQFVEEGYSRVIAVGGDGTVNETAKALINKPVALGIIPCGSGNGLARFLKIPLKLKEAIELQNNAQIIDIDCGTINKEPFFCTCGVGFDAHIGNKFAQSSKRGFWTYIKETVRSFFTYVPQTYKIKVDGVKTKSQAFLITVANAGQYGNDAYIAPQADIRDGQLDVCILSPFPKHRAFGIGIRLFNRTMDHCNYVQVKKGQAINIKRKKKGEVHLDGEPAIMGKKLKIRIIERGLNVVIPVNE